MSLVELPRKSKPTLQVSMFQIPEPVRVTLVKLSAKSVIDGEKLSINTLILQALEQYLNLPQSQQPEPKLPTDSLRNFTVRMTVETKHKLALTAAEWQVKLGIPVSMNSVLNTAVQFYLEAKR